MYDVGYKNIINIDIVPNVIKYMKLRSNDRPEMKCKLLLLILRGSNGCSRTKSL